jgi:hypothetical protein
MSEYRIEPKPGFSVADLMNQGFNITNAEIVRRVAGAKVESHVYTEKNFEMYSPLPPRDYAKKEIVVVGGRQYVMDKYTLSDYLYGGCNPYRQIIYFYVNENENAHHEELLDAVFVEARWLRRTSKNEKKINELIKDMRHSGYLNKQYDYYVIGDRRLQTTPDIYPMKTGFEPIVDKIWEFISENTLPSFSDIYKFIVVVVGWIHTDRVFGESKTQLAKYLKFMENKGYIKKVDEKYNVVKPPEPIEL